MDYKEAGYESMGTEWSIRVWDDVSDSAFNVLIEEIKEESREFDITYSRFKPESLVSKLDGVTGRVEVPDDFLKMLELYREFYLLTDKKLNPLIGHTISDLGYDSSYSLREKETVRETPDLIEAVEIIGEKEIDIKKGVLFDFGALGKGYFVDKIKEKLSKAGIKRFLVDGSGDIFYRGNGESIRVGLEDPRDTTKVIGTIEIFDGAMCGSGINKRAWNDYHHVIDPHTSKPIDSLVASWVLAPTCALADALASAVFFVPPERLSRYPFEYLLMNREEKIKRSARFHADLF